MPEPSQIEFSGDSRNSRGIAESSTYPLPPRHSRASATMNGVRLQTQNLASGSAIRRSAASCGSAGASTAAASRSASAVAASDSTARSAITFCISGFSESSEPKADRCATCHDASASARRINEAEPRTQSSRVAATISMIVRTPRPSSPSRCAQVPLNSSSQEALERLPSLSLRRTTSSRLRSPDGNTRGTTKQVTPSGACASTRNMSFIGAEVNHLWPCRVYSPCTDVGRASVWLVRTSEPPCFSVIPMPARAPAFSASGRRPGS